MVIDFASPGKTGKIQPRRVPFGSLCLIMIKSSKGRKLLRKMKILRISTAYPEYIDYFYRKNPTLTSASYHQQRTALEYDSFAWSNFWAKPMATHGYEMEEILVSSPFMQKAWWAEMFPQKHLPPDFDTIAIEQIKKFQPDILWFDDHSAPLLQKIKQEVKSIKLVLGWMGSAIPTQNAVEHIHCIISCAPETVEKLRAQGHNCEHMDHGFAPEILARLNPSKTSLDLIFIGQIIKATQFHEQRGKLLELLGEQLHLIIYSSLTNLERSHEAKIFLKKAAHLAYQLTKPIGMENIFERFSQKAVSQRNKKLEKFLRQPVFGLDMYQAISDAKVVLNIHADSSYAYASNMRLFETTGVGSCLLTDWKNNLPKLFDTNQELVSFSSAEECIEKAKFLLEHQKEREKIARAGQAKTLAKHTILHRSNILHEIIQKNLRK